MEAARKGLDRISSVMNSEEYDLLILEEINVAVTFGILKVENLLDILAKKTDDVELVLTGRGADSRIIEQADLVTEMRAVKHFSSKGVKARVGIEK